ncbi:hypothetical protein KUTeg_022852, partial [Tegillarca granosa]
MFILVVAFLSCVNAYVIDDSSGTSRRFDGIGGLSGGGATSKLLVNYPQPQRDQILDYLFKPNFGASLHILKVEIGGDAQSTDGTEASHMHNSWDENYKRGYEWWLMVEAKKRNPDILLYGLPWAFPGWVGSGSRSPYLNPELTASYIVKWILGAKQYYNLTIDYVGIWNERPYDIKYIKVLRNSLDNAGLSHTRIVAADSNWGISDDILKDTQLAAAIDFIGVHYPGTNSDDAAKQTGKQLWASEDYSTKNDNVGGGCWARILNQNYVNGLMTSTISWNLIASYYEALPYARDGLMTADSPWSGFYVVESPIWLSAHTTQFTTPGWKYLPHDKGVGKLSNGGSFVSFVSPDLKDLTVVIETMASIKELNVWYSKLGFKGQATTMFQDRKPVQVVNGQITLSLGLDEVYTLTTLTIGQKGSYPLPPPQKPFPLPYTEDFENYDISAEPGNLAQQSGSFEIVMSTDSHKQILQQMVTEKPTSWCAAEKLNRSINIIGNSSWYDMISTMNNIFIQSDVSLGAVNGTSGRTAVLSNGTADVNKGWNTIGLLVKGTKAVGSLNKKQLFSVSIPGFPSNGFVGIGTDTFGIANFDNILITDITE